MSQTNGKRETFLIVSPRRTLGGAERVSVLLANELARRGYEVHYLQYFVSDQDYEIDELVKIHLLDIKSKNLIVRKIKRFFKTILEVRAVKADYVIPFLGKMVDICFWATRFQRSSSLISTIRINPAVAPANRLARWWRNILCFLSDGVFVQNEQQKNYFPRFMHKKTFAIANPIDPKIAEINLGKGANIKRLVTAGRLTEQKNHLLLIEAFEKIAERYPYLKLSIYGDGPLLAHLEKRVAESDVEARITLHGRVARIQDNYRCGDLFILPSNYEGMPNALMEAMAMGLPSISTDCPTGPSDIIENYQNGILVPCNDCEKLAEAICFMLDAPDRAYAMAEKGKSKVESDYGIKSTVDRLVAECRKIGERNK